MALNLRRDDNSHSWHLHLVNEDPFNFADAELHTSNKIISPSYVGVNGLNSLKEDCQSLDPQFRLTIMIYPRGEKPGIGSAYGTHSEAHLHYTDNIDLADQEKNLLCECYIPGWIIKRDNQAVVRLKLEVYTTPSDFISALNILQKFDIALNEIEVVDTLHARNILRCAGYSDLLETRSSRNFDQLQDYIRQSTRIIPGGLVVYYSEIKGQRLITPSQFENVFSNINERSTVLDRLNTILGLYNKKNSHGRRTELDFVLVDEKYNLIENNKELKQLFADIAKKISSISEEEWPQKQQEIEQMLNLFLDQFRNLNNLLFRYDLINNPHWLGHMESYLRVIDNPTEGLEDYNFTSDVNGLLIPMPGGCIGYRDENGKLVLGPRIINSNEVVMSTAQQFGSLFSGRMVSEYASNPSLESHKYYKLVKGDFDLIEERSLEFRRETSPFVRALFNDYFARFPELEYIEISEVTDQFTLYDPNPTLVKKFGVLPRNAYVVIYRELGGEIKHDFLRINPWQDRKDISRYELTYTLRNKACQLFGLDIPEISYVSIVVEDDERLPNSTQLMNFSVRDYISGTPLQLMPFFDKDYHKYSYDLAEMLGNFAAMSIAVGRKYYIDDDVILLQGADGDMQLMLVECNSAFSESRVEDNYKSQVLLPAAEIACRVVVAEINQSLYRDSNDLLYINWPDEFVNVFLRSFEERLGRLQRKCLLKGESWLQEMNELFQNNDFLSDKSEYFDLRPAVDMCVLQLRMVNTDQAREYLKQAIRDFKPFFNATVENIENPGELELVLKEARALMTSTCWHEFRKMELFYKNLGTQSLTGVPSMYTPYSIGDVIVNDHRYAFLHPQERVHLLGCLHTCAWMAAMEVNIDSLCDTAADLLKNIHDRNEGLARFIQYSRSMYPHLRPQLAELFFLSISDEYGTSDHMGIRQRIADLKERGYIF